MRPPPRLSFKSGGPASRRRKRSPAFEGPAPLGAYGLLHGRQRADRPLFRHYMGWNRAGNRRKNLGGEFFTGDLDAFTRTGSIRPVMLPGGDRAILEIGRIALSLAADAGITDYSLIPLPEEKCRMLSRLLSAGSSPSASSIGRLFDGICALLCGRSQADYEGEGAALVEALVFRDTGKSRKKDDIVSPGSLLSAFLL